MFSSASLDGWLTYIQSVHFRSIDLDLERVTSVWQSLDNGVRPPTIAVAGTNGKGSSVAMLSAIYREGGYRVGSYTSPHLVRYNERIAINAEPCSDKEIIAALSDIEAARGGTPLTYFEFSTLAALRIFQQQKVDVQLLEVGMGGRLDAVNCIDNDLALITSIGLDHTAWLGETREAIAAEKAGIIKPHGRVVVSAPDSPEVIARVAAAQGARLWLFGQEFGFERTESEGGSRDAPKQWRFWHQRREAGSSELIFPLPFSGDHQYTNAAGVVMAVHALSDLLPVSSNDLKHGLGRAAVRARLQSLILNDGTRVLLDVAHNADSILQLGAQLRADSSASQRVVAVLGMLADKEVSPIIAHIDAHVDEWHFCSIDGERGQSAEALKRAFLDARKTMHPLPNDRSGVEVCHESPLAAFQAARQSMNGQGVVLIFGSFHTVGAIIPHLHGATETGDAI